MMVIKNPDFFENPDFLLDDEAADYSALAAAPRAARVS